jgi:hypothetical protein
MLEGRIAEKLLYSLADSGPEHEAQVTLSYFCYKFRRDIFNQSTGYPEHATVFYGNQDTYLIWDRTNQWQYTDNETCLSSDLDCALALPRYMVPLPGDWRHRSLPLVTFLLWASLLLLPSLLLSLSLLSLATPRKVPRLLLHHPQLLLSPVLSPFCPGPTPGWGSTYLSLSLPYTWLNSALHLAGSAAAVLFLVPDSQTIIISPLCHGLPGTARDCQGVPGTASCGVHRDYKLSVHLTIAVHLLAPLLTLLVLHLPCLRPEEVRQ